MRLQTGAFYRFQHFLFGIIIINSPSKRLNGQWQHAKYRREFIDSVLISRKSKQPLSAVSLYTLNAPLLRSKGGRALLELYGASCLRAISGEYPEEAIVPWKFSGTPHGWWQNLGQLFAAGDPIARASAGLFVFETIENYFPEYIEDNNQIRALPAGLTVWSRVSSTEYHQLRFLGGLYHAVLSLTAADASQIKNTALINTGAKSWEDAQFRRLFLDELTKRLGWKRLDDLYQLSQRSLYTSGAQILFQKYGGAIGVVLGEYPTHPWKPWKFSKSLQGWWTDLTANFTKNDAAVRHIAQDMIDELAEKYTVQTDQDWDRITLSSTEANQLSFMGGLSNVLATLYPSRFTKPPIMAHPGLSASLVSPRSRVAQLGVIERYSPNKLYANYWKVKENRLAFMSWLFKQLQRRDKTESEEVVLERFYLITRYHIHKMGVDGLLRAMQSSFTNAVLEAFPHHNWKIWKFDEKKHDRAFWQRLGGDYFNQNDNDDSSKQAEEVVKSFILDLATKHDIRTFDQWDSVGVTQIGAGDTARLNLLGGKFNLLAKLYPQHHWSKRRAPSHHSRKTEQELSDTVDYLLPQVTNKDNQVD